MSLCRVAKASRGICNCRTHLCDLQSSAWARRTLSDGFSAELMRRPRTPASCSNCRVSGDGGGSEKGSSTATPMAFGEKASSAASRIVLSVP